MATAPSSEPTTGFTWPVDGIAQELTHMISSLLDADDKANMMRVSKSFNEAFASVQWSGVRLSHMQHPLSNMLRLFLLRRDSEAQNDDIRGVFTDHVKQVHSLIVCYCPAEVTVPSPWDRSHILTLLPLCIGLLP